MFLPATQHHVVQSSNIVNYRHTRGQLAINSPDIEADSYKLVRGFGKLGYKCKLIVRSVRSGHEGITLTNGDWPRCGVPSTCGWREKKLIHYYV